MCGSHGASVLGLWDGDDDDVEGEVDRDQQQHEVGEHDPVPEVIAHLSTS